MVDNVAFEASGDPGWTVEIGDDTGLRLGSAFFGGGFDIAFVQMRFPETYVHKRMGVRRWYATNGRSGLVVIATPAACSMSDGAVYTHSVRLILQWREPEFRNLSGCGGRLVRSPDPE